ncbi:hypothetical protein J6590_106309 [Homalodisca vitripennis]|nr:hypothetical protein J6590_106309 [Homalodisca vitripennis]
MDESDIDDALDDDFSDRSLTDFSVSGSEYMPSDEESDVTSAEELNEEDGVVSDLDELELMEVDEEYQRVREESGDEEGNNIENKTVCQLLQQNEGRKGGQSSKDVRKTCFNLLQRVR